jgi:hypothetical protein
VLDPSVRLLVVQIFAEELRRGRVPDADNPHVRELADLIEDAYAARGWTSDTEHCHSRAIVERAVTEMRQALATARATMGRDAWERYHAANVTWLPALLAAQELAPRPAYLYPPPPEPPRRGRPSDPELYQMAGIVARLVRDALLVAGHRPPISLDAKEGPVVRIGACVIAILLGKNRVAKATFSDWVQRSPKSLR